LLGELGLEGVLTQADALQCQMLFLGCTRSNGPIAFDSQCEAENT